MTNEHLPEKINQLEKRLDGFEQMMSYNSFDELKFQVHITIKYFILTVDDEGECERLSRQNTVTGDKFEKHGWILRTQDN